jgi:hypothetical protein
MEKLLADMEPASEDQSLLLSEGLPPQAEDTTTLHLQQQPETDLLAPLGKTVMEQVSSSLQLDSEESLAPSLATFPLVLQLSDLDCPKFCISIQVTELIM